MNIRLRSDSIPYKKLHKVMKLYKKKKNALGIKSAGGDERGDGRTSGEREGVTGVRDGRVAEGGRGDGWAARRRTS